MNSKEVLEVVQDAIKFSQRREWYTFIGDLPIKFIFSNMSPSFEFEDGKFYFMSEWEEPCWKVSMLAVGQGDRFAKFSFSHEEWLSLLEKAEEKLQATLNSHF